MKKILAVLAILSALLIQTNAKEATAQEFIIHLKDECKQGNQELCVLLGKAYVQGYKGAIETNATKGMDLFKKACFAEKGNEQTAKGCYYAFRMHMEKLKKSKDEKATLVQFFSAAAMAQAGCEQGNKKCCESSKMLKNMTNKKSKK